MANDTRSKTDPVHREVNDVEGHGDHDTNPDLITGNPGSHPAGTGIGAASGAATGAAVGALGGPIGAMIGGVAGAVVGGLVGHGIGEAVDPTEDEYWRENHADREYVKDDVGYDDYEPAYRLGYNAADAHENAPYDDEVEAKVAGVYEDRRGESSLEWDDAKPAVRDAYERRAERMRSESAT